MLASLAAKVKCPLLYCNLVGGNDELVFDGSSLVFNAAGQLAAQGEMFAEDFLLVDPQAAKAIQPRRLVAEGKLYKALVPLLLHSLHHSGFPSAVLRLSGR